jgi:hypothetical protein
MLSVVVTVAAVLMEVLLAQMEKVAVVVVVAVTLQATAQTVVAVSLSCVTLIREQSLLVLVLRVRKVLHQVDSNEQQLLLVLGM